jgi:hypothetical protein
MTTIAVSSTHISWDSRICYSGNIIMRVGSPKVRVFKHRLLGLAGDYQDLRRVNTWVDKGCPKKEQPGGVWDLLIIDADGLRHMQQNEDSPTKVLTPFAIGSGREFALGVLALTHDALQAVKIAAQFDSGTGPPFSSIAYHPLIEKFKAARKEARKTKAKKSV